jgi:hypothetical protein
LAWRFSQSFTKRWDRPATSAIERVKAAGSGSLMSGISSDGGFGMGDDPLRGREFQADGDSLIEAFC